LEVIDRKGPGREIVFVSPDTRRAIWEMLVKHHNNPQKIARTLKVSHDAIKAAIISRHYEEIDKAIERDRAARGPRPPAAPMRRLAA
jgi:hypothetical protein